MLRLKAEDRPVIDTDVCFCCNLRNGSPLEHDIRAWWEPSVGHGYGEDGRLITLCLECIRTLQFFVELGGPPPPLR